MRRGPLDSGWAGSLFPEPLAQVKPVLSLLQFPAGGPFPDDHCELVYYAHETWKRFLLDGHLVEEFVSTDKPIQQAAEGEANEKAVDDAREAAGNLPLARCSVQNGIRTYEDPELWPDKAAVAASVCWGHQTCENGRSAHQGQACAPKNLNCPRGNGDGYCGLEAKQYEAQCEKQVSVDPETETIEDLAMRLTQIAERDGEKILEKLYGVSIGMIAAAAVDTIKIASRELTGDKVAMFLKNAGHLGTRAQRRDVAVGIMREVGNWSAWHRAPAVSAMPFHVGDHVRLHSMVGRVRAITDRGFIEVDFDKHNFGGSGRPEEVTLEPEVVAVPEKSVALAKKTKAKKPKPEPAPAPLTKNDQEMQFLRSDIVAINRLLAELPADHVIERLGFESRKQEHEERLAILAPAVNPVKEPVKQAMPDGYVRAKTMRIEAKTKKQPKAPRHDENYCVLRGGDCSVYNGCQNGDVPCTLKDVPHLKEIHLPCEVHALLDLAIKPTKEPMAVLLDGKWWSAGKMLWDCSDCLCLQCANEGKSCHDCKGFERCMKHVGKIGACPDFRTEEGKEQHCLENGCLCFKCQLIGEHCEDCPGPIRCDGPRMKCKEYVGADTTDDPYTPALPAAELDVPDLVKVGDLVTRLHARGYIYEIRLVTRVEKTDAGWQICGDLWDDFRHPKRKKVSKNEPIIRWGVTGWKAEGSKIVPLGQKVAQETFGATYDETYADERLIVLTLEQVTQLVAVEEAEDMSGPTNYTRVWLKPEKAKGHKNEQGYLEDPRTRWPCLGHARFVDTSAAAVAKIPSGRRAEVCQDEPECEACHCHTCAHQKACRLDNTLGPCSPCKTFGGAHHHKAVDCEGCTPGP